MNQELHFELPNGNTCSYKLLAYQLLEIKIEGYSDFDVEDAKFMVEKAGEFGQGQKFKSLILVGPEIEPSPKAQAYSSSPEGCKYKLADAFVVNNVAQKLIGNFIIRFFRPEIPTKVFSDQERALEWLNELP
jgi:hypothetical protein